MTSQEFSMEKLTEMALTAMRQAVARVMEDHRLKGKPVAIWKDGRVVLKIPGARVEVREPPAQYESGPPAKSSTKDGITRGGQTHEG